jgi:hypothetical protein
MGNSVPLSEDLREFVNSAQWTFAKTYAATWPHEYIVRKRVDESLFIALVTHIRTHGYEGQFYRLTLTYFDEGDYVYWTMGEPIDETEIVNRCRRDQTYEYRLAHNLLPEQQKETPIQPLEVTAIPRRIR